VLDTLSPLSGVNHRTSQHDSFNHVGLCIDIIHRRDVYGSANRLDRNSHTWLDGLKSQSFHYFAPVRSAKLVLRSAYMSVCLPCCSHLKNALQISPNFLHMLPVAVARPSSYGNAICYVLPVVWMTSGFHISKGKWRFV